MLPDRTWKVEWLLRAFLGALLFMMLAGTVAHGVGMGEAGVWRVVAGTVSFHGGILVGVAILLAGHGVSWAEMLGMRQARLGRSAGFAALVTLVFLPVALGLSFLSAFVMRALYVEPAPQQAVAAVQEAAGSVEVLAMAVLAVGLAPVAEELLFRGLLYPGLKARWGVVVAGLVTSLLFGAIHFNVMSFVPLTVFACVLVGLYEGTGTLAAPVVAHATFNLANFALLVLQ